MNNNTHKTVIGIDLGDKKHAICAIDQDGNILKEYFIYNRADDLEQLSKDFPEALMALEVGTHSPWISRLLEDLGHEVLVANARKLRAIYTNIRKSDELDARMLAKIARLDSELLHPIQHISKEAQHDLLSIKLRDTIVRQRVHIITSIRFLIKSLGIKIKSPSSASFATYARKVLLEHPSILEMIEPSLAALDAIGLSIKKYDKQIELACREKYPETQRLQQIAGVGPITSLCFVLTIADAVKFKKTRDVGAYLGLVPRRDQSGDSDKQLPISKAGNGQLRKLLVQCAQYILGHFGPDCDLRRQGLKLAARGGKAAKKKAVTAIARKLAVLLLTLQVNQSDYKPFMIEDAAEA